MSRKPRRSILAIVLLGVPLLAGAVAQQESKRTIRGQVLDPDGKAVASAIVHLKNLSGKTELSVVTDKEGRYQFNDLDKKTDFEIYAEWQEQKSRPRKISQFDTRERITLNLSLEPAKKANEEPKDQEQKKD